MHCIDLTEDVIKILGIYFSYNKKLEQEKYFLNHLVKIRNLAISKLIRLALVTEIPTIIINLLTKILMEFIWKDKNPNIKNSTLCNDN